MSQDLSQWLAEIQTLRQTLAQAQEEREAAYASAANWRQRYEAEAQQRRTEANLSRQKLERLMAQLQELQGSPTQSAAPPGALADHYQAEVEQVQSLPELKGRLVEALLDCDRLQQALKTEQENHAQTRRNLTTALGDAIDRLSRGQTEQG